jgi:hypothetical protein
MSVRNCILTADNSEGLLRVGIDLMDNLLLSAITRH